MPEAAAKAITPRPKLGRARQEIIPYTGPVVSRAEALEQGLVCYFPGTPCKHGHIAQRQTGNQECRTCSRLRGRKRVLSAEYKANRKAYREANRDRINEYRRATAVTLGPKRNIVVKRWYQSEKGKAWWREYADKKRAIVRNRRAKQRESEGRHTAEDVAEILKLQRGRCAYCRKPVGNDYHVDHIVSVAKGGTNDRRNLQIACAFCNVSKGERDPIDHAQRIGLLI